MSGNHDPLDDDDIDEASDHVSRHQRGHSDDPDEDTGPTLPSDSIYRQPGPP